MPISLPDPPLRLNVVAAERTGARLHGDVLPAVRTTAGSETGTVLGAAGAREDADKNYDDNDQKHDFHRDNSTTTKPDVGRLSEKSPLRPRYGDAADPSPALDTTPASRTGAGEALSEPQQLALLAMRRSELSEAVRAELRQRGTPGPWGRNFYELARLGLAVHSGSFHVLTPRGRYSADKLALETARKLGMHIVTYNFGRPGSAARAYCTCGWSTIRSRAVGNYMGMLQRDAHHHRLHVEQQDAAFEQTVVSVGHTMAAS